MRYTIKFASCFTIALAAIGVAAFVFVKGYPFYAVLIVLVALIVAWLPFQSVAKQQKEFYQFVEDVEYRDFTRTYNTRKGSYEVKKQHKALNELNRTFRIIRAEREAQFIYLQRILEVVNTGILTYEANSGEITWMNEAFKQLFKTPQIKNMAWIESRNPYLYEAIDELEVGESKLVEVPIGLNAVKVLANLSSFQTEGKQYKLFAFQNVRDTLEEAESTAWKRLLSVMTHEIMNSVTPISSLADTLLSSMGELASKPEDKREFAFDDLNLGIETIKRRSDGLLGFAQAYRSLNKTVELQLSAVAAADLFENLHHLMAPSLEQKGILLEVELNEPIPVLHIDRGLVEQVIINLITNAADAVRGKEDARILLYAGTSANGKHILKVGDNGSGIPADLLDKIFIPFFSSKKKGSGIGLSLSRQIVQQHKGSLQVQTEEGRGSVFVITL